MLSCADTDSTDWELNVNSFLRQKLSDAVFMALNFALNTISDENIDTIKLKNKMRNSVITKSNYLLKKGGYINDIDRKNQKRAR